MCCKGTALSKVLCNQEKVWIDYIMESSNSGTCEEQKNELDMLNEMESIFQDKQLENGEITS